MAEMIPESLAAAREATTGEKRVFKVLRDGLLPDEDFLVWFEPKTARRRPDFLVWAQDLGLLVIEVKDWTLAQIVQASPMKWTIRHDGRVEARESPTEQARRCFIGFKELLQKSPLLRRESGPNRGGLVFPIGFCAAFTQITRKQAGENGLLAVLDPVFCLFSDDLPGDLGLREAQRLLLSKLKQGFLHRFPFAPLRPEQMTALRSLIFPEVRIHNPRARVPLRDAGQEGLVAALDLAQERTAKSILEGHRILKGVAGSGKTLVLSCRAKYLRRVEPGWRILIVCFNLSLCQYIKQLLRAGQQEGVAQDFDVFHYHGLVKHMTRKNLTRQDDETQEAWDGRVGIMLREAVRSNGVARYDAILIDEGQDFAVEWLQSLTELLNDKTDSLLLCLDPAQNIFGRKVTYKSVGIKVVGKRPVSLETSYRNTQEILTLARLFSGVQQNKQEPPAEAEQGSFGDLLFPTAIDRHGSPPSIVYGIPFDDQIEFILNRLQEHLEDEACAWCDIAVLYADPANRFAEGFLRAFAPRFGEDRVYWVARSRDHKMNLDLSTPSVKLSTIESAKGLEFRIVFLVGLEALPRPARDQESERNLTYVGLTRAQDLLYILGERRSGHFDELIRIAEDARPAQVPVSLNPVSLI